MSRAPVPCRQPPFSLWGYILQDAAEINLFKRRLAALEGLREDFAEFVQGGILNEELHYRLCSAIIHSQSSALQQLGFRVVDRKVPTVETSVSFLEKYFKAEMGSRLCSCAAVTFARVAWYGCQLFGYDEETMRSFLNKRFDEMGVKAKFRIWNSVSAS
jgi:hypothetical protein